MQAQECLEDNIDDADFSAECKEELESLIAKVCGSGSCGPYGAKGYSTAADSKENKSCWDSPWGGLGGGGSSCFNGSN
jgi:hypothetical protein